MLLTSLFLAASPLALPAAQEGGAQDLVVIYSAGGEACFPDAKDQAFLNALRLVGARINELPGEVPDFPPLPPDVMPLVGRVMGGPMTFRLGAVPNDPSMMVPFYGQLTLPGASADDAKAITSHVSNLLGMAGMPIQPDAEGKVPVPGAPTPIWYGPEGDNFVLAFGFDDGGRVEPGYTGLPDGVQPTLAASIEYGQLMKTIFTLAEAYGGGAEMAPTMAMFEGMNLYDMSFQVASGHDSERAYTTFRMPGYAASMRAQGMMPTRALTEKDVRLVPADAVYASVSTMNVGGMLDMMLGFAEQAMAESGMGGNDPLEMLAGMTGIHLRTDLVDHLGSVMGLYSSDTTGGGGVMSMVMFVEVTDADALADTHGRIIGMLNGILGQQAMGYVEFRDWEEQGVDYTTLTFPGLPIPLEITSAVANGYAFWGLTPQAVMAAVYQAKTGANSLLDNPSFREQLAGGVDGLMAVQYLDTPRLVREGYGTMSLLASALRNGTRSRMDAGRDAGMVLPAYPVLAQGAKATVTATRADGDDWVAESRGDRSFVVNMTSGLGALTASPIGLVLLAGVGIAVAEENGMRF